MSIGSANTSGEPAPQPLLPRVAGQSARHAGVAMLAVVVIAALVPGLLTHYDPVKLLLQDKFLPPSPSTGSAPTTSGATSTRVVYGAA